MINQKQPKEKKVFHLAIQKHRAGENVTQVKILEESQENVLNTKK